MYRGFTAITSRCAGLMASGSFQCERRGLALAPRRKVTDPNPAPTVWTSLLGLVAGDSNAQLVPVFLKFVTDYVRDWQLKRESDHFGNAAREFSNMLDKFDEEAKTFQKNNMDPLYIEDPVYQALYQRIGQGDSKALVLLAPGSSGKTGRAFTACRELIKEKRIAGAVAVDFEDRDDPLGTFYRAFNADPKSNVRFRHFARDTGEGFWKWFRSTTTGPHVIILDNVEQETTDARKKSFEFIARLEQRCKHLNWIVLLLLRCPETTREWKDLDKSNRVQLIASGDSLSGGSEIFNKGWQAKGLKWKEDDCKKFIDKLQSTDRVWNDAQVGKVLKMATRAGTPGFIHRVYKDCRVDGCDVDGIIAESEDSDLLKMVEEEWQSCKEATSSLSAKDKCQS